MSRQRDSFFTNKEGDCGILQCFCGNKECGSIHLRHTPNLFYREELVEEQQLWVETSFSTSNCPFWLRLVKAFRLLCGKPVELDLTLDQNSINLFIAWLTIKAQDKIHLSFRNLKDAQQKIKEEL